MDDALSKNRHLVDRARHLSEEALKTALRHDAGVPELREAIKSLGQANMSLISALLDDHGHAGS